MLKGFRGRWKKKIFQVRSFFIAKIAKIFLNLLMMTCRVEIKGGEQFRELAGKEKCILMLWHNRIAPLLFVLSRYTPCMRYAAFVSASRDGDVLSNMIHSYKNGDTIRVPHLARFQALRSLVNHVKMRKHVVVITPDGPRGPCYEIKPGIAVAALETKAHIIPLKWEAKDYWELKTWDKFRLPKPFSTLSVTFGPSICFDCIPQPSLKEVQAILKEKLDVL